MTHKLLARRLRALLRPVLPQMRHGHALDLLAAAHGLDSWNALSQRPDQPPLPEDSARRALARALAACGPVPDDLLDQAARLVGRAPLPEWTGPVSTGAWRPPFAVLATASVDVQDWVDGRIAGETDDGEPNPDLRAVQVLAQTLEGGAADLELDLPGLTDWARARGWRVSGEDLLRWIHARGGGVLTRSEGRLIRREGLLLSSEGLMIGGEGETLGDRFQPVSLHPTRWVSAVWSFGPGEVEADASAYAQVRAFWTEQRLNAAARRALRLLDLPERLVPDVRAQAALDDDELGPAALLAALLILTGETDAAQPRQTLAACLSPEDDLRAAFAGSDDPAVLRARAALPDRPAAWLTRLAGALITRGVPLPMTVTWGEGRMRDWTVGGHVTVEGLTALVRAHEIDELTVTQHPLTPDVEAALERMQATLGVRVLTPLRVPR